MSYCPRYYKIQVMRINSKFQQILSVLVVPILVAISLLTIFLYKLDYTALSSYDEAWYGEITRNLATSKNPFRLMFDGKIFTDHPPFGFMVMVIPTAILGSSEFSVRLVSAVAGFGCVLLVYLLGKKMAGEKNVSAVGISAAAILMSCMWFIFRARSGNLDIPFMFWEILTIYLLLLKNRAAVYFAALSFAALVLTKTLVGFGLVPVILLIIFAKIRKNEVSIITLIKAAGVWLICVLPWYYVNQQNDNSFLRHHFFEIGARGNRNDLGSDALSSSLNYLAIGIGKWYKVFLVSTAVGILSFITQKKQRFNLAVLFLWFLGFAVFLLSSQTEIWHLIPLYPIISLIIPLSLATFIDRFLPKKNLAKIVVSVGIVILAVYQFRQFANLFYLPEPAQSDEKDISIKAGKYENIHLLDTFYPAAVYYSQKNVDYLFLDQKSYQKMTEKLEAESKDVFIITETLKQQLEKSETHFTVLEKNNSYYLVSR